MWKPSRPGRPSEWFSSALAVLALLVFAGGGAWGYAAVAGAEGQGRPAHLAAHRVPRGSPSRRRHHRGHERLPARLRGPGARAAQEQPVRLRATSHARLRDPRPRREERSGLGVLAPHARTVARHRDGERPRASDEARSVRWSRQEVREPTPRSPAANAADNGKARKPPAAPTGDAADPPKAPPSTLRELQPGRPRPRTGTPATVTSATWGCARSPRADRAQRR